MRHRTIRTLPILAATGLLAGSLASTGCYKRVVRSKGFGASTTQVYDANMTVPKSTKKSDTAHKRKAKWDY